MTKIVAKILHIQAGTDEDDARLAAEIGAHGAGPVVAQVGSTHFASGSYFIVEYDGGWRNWWPQCWMASWLETGRIF